MSDNGAIELLVKRFMELDGLLSSLYEDQSKRSLYLLLDESFRIRYASPHFYELVGVKQPNIDFLSLVEESEKAAAESELSKALVSGQIEIPSLTFKDKNKQSAKVKLISEAACDNSGRCIAYKCILIPRDELLAELEKQRIKAEDANMAKTEFLANISHEIRTPMNAILGFTELLQDEITDSNHRQYLEAVTTSGNNLMMIINDILDLSRLEAEKIEISYSEVNLESLIDDVLQIFRLDMEQKGLHLEKNIDSDLPNALMLDNTHLRQILINLIGNAVKFTSEGSIVVNAVFSQIAESNTGSLTLSVEDTGIGIPEDQQKVIFESFRQQSGHSSRKYGGTGLGLAITKRLTEKMRGFIKLESTVGKGSVFTVHFPVVELSDSRVPVAGKDATGEYVFKGGSVLVVDDVPLNKELLQNYIKQAGFKTFTASNGSEALGLLDKKHIDLVFMDIKMPVMSGLEAIRKMKKHDNWKAIPVIAVTASVFYNPGQEPDLLLFDDFLKKPVNRSTILKKMAEYPVFGAEIVQGSPKKDDNEKLGHELKSLTKVQVEELLTILNKLKSSQKAMIMSEVERTSDELKNLGVKYKIELLKVYGDAFLGDVKNFDVVSITKRLENFENMLMAQIVPATKSE